MNTAPAQERLLLLFILRPPFHASCDDHLIFGFNLQSQHQGRCQTRKDQHREICVLLLVDNILQHIKPVYTSQSIKENWIGSYG